MIRRPTDLTILHGDAVEHLRAMPTESVQCVVTSPPYYGLRSYLKADDPAKILEIGTEETPEAYVLRMVEVFHEVRRVLRQDGTLWLNLGDSYTSGGRKTRGADAKDSKNGRESDTRPAQPAGLKPKDLIGIPWRVAFALQADGWYLRQDIVWSKPNAMPESVRDRCTRSHEFVFMFTKSSRYFYDHEAVKEDAVSDHTSGNGFKREARLTHCTEGVSRESDKEWTQVGGKRNRRSVWSISTKPYKGAHFAVFPPDLIEPCIKAGTSEHGCCAHCCAPFERLFERTDEVDASAKGSRFDTGKTGDRDGGDRTQAGERFLSRAAGWKRMCDCEDCEDTPVACTVLDPFGGSGTTAMVALNLGRRAVLIELNANYLPLIRQRCGVSDLEAA